MSEQESTNIIKTSRIQILTYFIIGIIFVSILILMCLTLFFQDIFCQGETINGIDFLKQIVCWLDPVFTVYNLALLLLIVMVVPTITFIYVNTMQDRKQQRLLQQIPNTEVNINKIKKILDETFQIDHYAGSMTLLSIVILLGGMIILILKPLTISEFNTHNGFGVDYSKGVNFLMLGSYMHYYVESRVEEYMRVLVGTLTAFQFGFLGAYVYFITHLIRSYFTLDLSPNVYISCTVRIMMGTILSLIMSFFLISGSVGEDAPKTNQEGSQIVNEVVQNNSTVHDQPQVNKISSEAGLVISNYYYYLPIFSFFIGFFPLRGLLLIERTVGGFLHLMPVKYESTKLTNLLGMSYQHEIRLKREGFDNVENLVSADIIDLAIRSGFYYHQLEQWQSQAKLTTHLGDDYARFRQATSINSVDELHKNANLFSLDTNNGELASIIDESLYQKTKIILNTIQQNEKQS